jgi:hypothetical protein
MVKKYNLFKAYINNIIMYIKASRYVHFNLSPKSLYLHFWFLRSVSTHPQFSIFNLVKFGVMLRI